MKYKVGLAAINVPPESVSNMTKVMESGNIGQASEFLAQFEQMLCAYTGAKHCIVTSSGTMADAVAVAAMKVKYHPRRVVLPALTFIAQANAVYYNGLDVEFVDVDENYLMDWKEAEKFDYRTSLYFPSACLGRPCQDTTDQNGEKVIADSCEAFGSTLHGFSAGKLGELGTFSFFVSHTVTTGEGGAIITDDDWLAKLCRSLRSHGRASDVNPLDKFSFPHLGFNGKLTAPQAAIGCGVMEHIEEYVERRHENYVVLQNLLGGFPEREGEYIVAHGFPIEFKNEMDRNSGMRGLLEAGIECRKFFSCIPTMEAAYSYLRQPLGRYPHAEHIAHTHLYVPCHQNMTFEEVLYVASNVRLLNGRVRHEAYARAESEIRENV